MAASSRSKTVRRRQGLWARQGLQRAAVTSVVGLSSIILANLSLRGLCDAAHIPNQFQPAHSFLWRLEFLRRLPSGTANEFLDRVARQTSRPDVKKVIVQLREAIHESADWVSTAFMREAHESLSAPGSKSQKEYLLALNHTVWAFLWPPKGVFLGAVATDFAEARMTTIPNVTRSLFVHTIFYYSHREAMPGYAALITFRNKGADEILDCYKRHSFFHRGKGLSYNVLWCLWLAQLSILAAVTKKRNPEMAVVYYAAALTLVGLTIMLANCLLAEFQSRYTLPMWELTIISMTVAFGRSMEHWLDPGRKLLGSTEFESPASPSAALRHPTKAE